MCHESISFDWYLKEASDDISFVAKNSFLYYVLEKGVLEAELRGGLYFWKIQIQTFMVQKILKKNMRVCKDVTHMCVKIHDEIPWVATCTKKTNPWSGRMNSIMC